MTIRETLEKIEYDTLVPRAAKSAETRGRDREEPEDDIRRAEAPEPSWRGSSFDLKHGLEVVELPTSLPVDVLDRLFNARGK